MARKTAVAEMPPIWVIWRDAMTDTGKMRGTMMDGQSEFGHVQALTESDLRNRFKCEFQVTQQGGKIVIAGFSEKVDHTPLFWARHAFGELADSIQFKDHASDTWVLLQEKGR
jgi:hypothetical protein